MTRGEIFELLSEAALVLGRLSTEDRRKYDLREPLIDELHGCALLVRDGEELSSPVAGCPGDPATCFCDTHYEARESATLAGLTRRERRALRRQEWLQNRTT